MKKYVSVLLFVFLVCMVYASGAGEQWKQVASISIEHPVTVCGFNNPDFGITAGYAGETHFTPDRGKTWPRSKINAQCRFVLDIIDDETAVSCGNGGLAMTSDGGKTWSVINKTRYPFISFSDPRTGWLIGSPKPIRTADNGKTWEEIALPIGISKIQDVCIIDYDTAFFLDKKGTIHTTIDGGVTWEVINPIPGIIAEGFTPVPVLARLRFVSRDKGLFIIRDNSETDRWLFCETLDMGKTWSINAVEGIDGLNIFISHDAKTVTFMNIANVKKEVQIYQDKS